MTTTSPKYGNCPVSRSYLDPVDAILNYHSCQGPWQQLPATGVANRIYATQELVLRIAVEGKEAPEDARTESVAAPVARAAGVLVPRLIAFDDSGAIVDRPYSLWERVHGETLGLFAPDPRLCPQTWQAVGRQLALLHNRVQECPDPHKWLDHPERDLDLEARIAALAGASVIDRALALELERTTKALRPAVEGPVPERFLHNDVHAMNIMCSRNDVLLALLDWGDAGWGDPALELAEVPLTVVPLVLQGYRSEGYLDDAAEPRILWDKLSSAAEQIEQTGDQDSSLAFLLAWVRRVA
jgi:aminoglycoside phosphotransferase (APT) family kinase protein